MAVEGTGMPGRGAERATAPRRNGRSPSWVLVLQSYVTICNAVDLVDISYRFFFVECRINTNTRTYSHP